MSVNPLSIAGSLKLQSPVVLHGSFNRPNIALEVRPCNQGMACAPCDACMRQLQLVRQRCVLSCALHPLLIMCPLFNWDIIDPAFRCATRS